MKVLIVEPVLAAYRVPLFSRLAALGDISLRVVASRKFPGSPDSVSSDLPWVELTHECRSLFGDRCYWQRGLHLPKEFGRGDVLVIDSNPRTLSNFPLLCEAKRRGVGVVLWGHGWSPTSKLWRARLRFRLMNLADAVLVYTDTEVAWLRQQLSWKSELFATNNALDQEPVRLAVRQWTPDKLAQFQKERNLLGRKLLLFCGRLRSKPPTHVHLALQALARLVAIDPSVMFGVIGTGDAESGLRRLAEDLGVANNVCWVGPLYEENSLAPWFLSAACFVYPGAIGLSLLHAFGYGLPVVTHNRRDMHNPEIAALVEGENGVMFEFGSEADLAETLHTVISDPILRKRLSVKAVETVSTHYSMDSMAKRFEAALREASRRSLLRILQT